MGPANASAVTAFGQFSVLAVSGEADLASAPRLAGDLEAAAAATPGGLVLDLTALEFMDSTALCLLLGARQRLAEDGRELIVVVTDRHLQRLFEISGLAPYFRFADSLEAAMRWVVTERPVARVA
ncbi:MAG TPA: STAS domain-containing protein [Thermoleophilia bacterium]|nr:STAS domain-containing protein [Thermoleophilia bacterium]